MSDNKNTLVLITGGNKGIGKATAILFSEKGYTVLFTSRSSESHSQLEDEYKSKGAASAKGYVLDIRQKESSVQLVQAVQKDFGKIDILINNAGIGIFSGVGDMTSDQWKDVIDTNLTGVFYLTHEVLPGMIGGKQGHIVNVGSLASRNTFSGGGAYCASKFGLLGFSECLMLDVREYNIKVSMIMPGSVNTSFNDHSVDDDQDTWKLTSEDVAEAIYDVVNTRSGHLMSRIELRPTNPARKK